MEYPFKLSEIIAGCESGAWIEGAVFTSSEGNTLVFYGEYFDYNLKPSINSAWNFVFYMEV